LLNSLKEGSMVKENGFSVVAQRSEA